MLGKKRSGLEPVQAVPKWKESLRWPRFVTLDRPISWKCYSEMIFIPLAVSINAESKSESSETITILKLNFK